MFSEGKLLPSSFNKEGLLPAKDYTITFSQLRRSLLIQGPKKRPLTWDRAWRMRLVDNLEILVKQLWQVGITGIYIDGSFVENKDHPNDIDGYFECDLKEYVSGELQNKLNLIDAHKVWTWDRKDKK